MAPNAPRWTRTSENGYPVWYTTPREFIIEYLPNGKYRVFHYGPNLTHLADSLQEANEYCSFHASQQRCVTCGEMHS